MHKKQFQGVQLFQTLQKSLLSANQSLKTLIKTSIRDEHLPLMKQTVEDIWGNYQKQNEDSNVTSINLNESIFSRIPNVQNPDMLEKRNSQSKLNFITPRRKDQLFKRLRKDQQEKMTTRKKQLEKIYKSQLIGSLNNQNRCGDITLKFKGQQHKITITSEDILKLQPQIDLNDTIVEGYLKIIRMELLDPRIGEETFIYSPYFMEKLLDEYIKDDIAFFHDRDSQNFLNCVKKKASQNYQKVKKWTKKVDILSMKYLVIPINAFKHWNCIIVVNPKCLSDTNNGKGYILYCDSMFQKRPMFIEALRTYLHCELRQKKQKSIEISQKLLPSHQLLLPRQTNSHDCGLYLMTYIEFLLSSETELINHNFNKIEQRNQLQLFPRSIIITMRQRLRKLFINLVNDPLKHSKIMAAFKMEKNKILTEAQQEDYDTINERQLKKYYRMNASLWDQGDGSQERQNQYECEVRFYLDPQVNFYEKDRI